MLDIRESKGYGNIGGHNILNFLDNHDTQRYDSDKLLTHKNSYEYKIAIAYMLATTYGAKRLISSYAFDNIDQGPPSVGEPTYEVKTN